MSTGPPAPYPSTLQVLYETPATTADSSQNSYSSDRTSDSNSNSDGDGEIDTNNEKDEDDIDGDENRENEFDYSEAEGNRPFDLRSSVLDFLSQGTGSVEGFAQNCVFKSLDPLLKLVLHRLDDSIQDHSASYLELKDTYYKDFSSVLHNFKRTFLFEAQICTLSNSDPIIDKLLEALTDEVERATHYYLDLDNTFYYFDAIYALLVGRDRTKSLTNLFLQPLHRLNPAPSSPASENDYEVEESDHNRGFESDEEPRSLHSIWKHLTISQDKTSAADGARELLLVLTSGAQWSDNKSSPHDYTCNVQESISTRDFRLKKLETDNLLKFHRLPNAIEHPIIQKGSPTMQTTGSPEPPMVGIRKSQHQSVHKLDPALSSRTRSGDDRSHTEGTDMPTAAQPLLSQGIASGQTPETLDGGLYDEMRRQITSLEHEIGSLKEASKAGPAWKAIYFIEYDSRQPASAYLDEPFWAIGANGGPILTAHLPIADIEGFLRQRQEIAFVVSKYYSPSTEYTEAVKASTTRKSLPPTQAFKEVITFNSQNMLDAVESFLELQPMFKEEFPDFNVRAHIAAPYLFWYHYRSPVALNDLSLLHRPLMQSMTDWIEEHYQALYTRVESQMENGVISQETMPFLIKPGDVLVWEWENKVNAVIAKSWSRREHLCKEAKPRGSGWAVNTGTNTEKFSSTWAVDGWRYSYDGRFLEKDTGIEIRFEEATMDHEVEINKLIAYPLRYASEHAKAVLEKRGQTFWKCRRRHVVSYADASGFYGSGDRFVVDFHTYRQLHHDSSQFKTLYPHIDNPEYKHMDLERLDSNDPPESPNIYVFPKTIPAYNLHSKKWVDLDVDSICDVAWNKQSFDHLVVDEDTRELVQALVMRQIAREQSTDIIDRKGNGLIMLLHGGPGTGKTFTAESVAEFAEKPLFRVTCGDIGTEPEQVEKYLESVLHLGKTWGCVVLIDEAEVFLEQRSLDNLARNALVSVFLRVLEYYEGILILTSNRVGTFDEAFKSRILLSLHYENLTRPQRMKIWKNFINRMKDMEKRTGLNVRESAFQSGSPAREFQDDNVEVDFDDVECYLPELSEYELNGRQIRNAITAARQLAMFRKKRMSSDHLKHVIRVSSKFDKYLMAVQDDQTSDQIARSDGFR